MTARMLIPKSFQMPNAYVDEVLPHLSGVETKILVFVVRMTFGWNKTEEHLSIGFIVEHTGVGRSQAFAALARLVEMGVLTRVGEGRRSSTFGLQLDAARFNLPVIEGDECPKLVQKSDLDNESKSEIPDLAVRNTGLSSPAGRTNRGGTPYTLNPTLNPLDQTQEIYTAREENPISDLPKYPKPSQKIAGEQRVSAAWLVLIEQAGSPPVPGLEYERWTAVWRDLQAWAVGAGLDDTGLADEIRRRAPRYRRQYTTPFSIPALGGNWAALAAPVEVAPVPLAPAEPVAEPVADDRLVALRARREAEAAQRAALLAACGTTERQQVKWQQECHRPPRMALFWAAAIFVPPEGDQPAALVFPSGALRDMARASPLGQRTARERIGALCKVPGVAVEYLTVADFEQATGGEHDGGAEQHAGDVAGEAGSGVAG